MNRTKKIKEMYEEMDAVFNSPEPNKEQPNTTPDGKPPYPPDYPLN